MWKEYALSDSRYLTSDPFMICVEAITVVSGPCAYPNPILLGQDPKQSTQTVWGPLSFATAISIARTGSLRHPLQIIVSVGHLYGVALYYATCFVEEKLNGITYSRPEAQYYWGYFLGCNMPWVIAPASESSDASAWDEKMKRCCVTC